MKNVALLKHNLIYICFYDTVLLKACATVLRDGRWLEKITRRNLFKNQKYFNPLLSGQGRLALWEKKTGRKSRLTVPLKRIRKSHMTQRSMILGGDSKKLEYLGENETKNEIILTHWSVPQASSNDEKNWGSEISLDCPFKWISYWER